METEYISREEMYQANKNEWEDVIGLYDGYTVFSDNIDMIDSVPAADVVTREAFNLILTENDIMREQLAKIGKKPGDKMGDVIKLPTFEESGTEKWINCLPVPWWDLQNKVDEIDKVKE